MCITLPGSATEILQAMKAQHILGGLSLEEFYPNQRNTLLVCATETKTKADLDRYIDVLNQALKKK